MLRKMARSHFCGVQTAWTEAYDVCSAIAEIFLVGDAGCRSAHRAVLSRLRNRGAGIRSGELISSVPVFNVRRDLVGRRAIGIEPVAEARAATRATLPTVVVTADHSGSVEAIMLESRCALIRKTAKAAQLRSLLSFMFAFTKTAEASVG